jgi:protein-tyrosine phosphatase
MRKFSKAIVTGFAIVLSPACAMAAVDHAEVLRPTPDQLSIRWADADPVDIYQGDQPGFPLKGATPLVRQTTTGTYTLKHVDTVRRYFILVDTRDHRTIEVAERLVPLAQGSNFRDVGGYVGAGGRHVRWGLIYRSGGQPMLTAADLDIVHGLNISQLVDLRSSEERVIAPTKITGVPYTAVGYSMAEVMRGPNGQQLTNSADVYRKFPYLLAPQLKIVFAHLLHEQTPIAYNCSAGQDRTGFVTAMILSALGVPFDTIVADYHLSTTYRRPEFEMAPINPALAASDPVAGMFAQYQKSPQWKVAQPLKGPDGAPFLKGAFDEITEKWGSVDAYLAKEAGVGPTEIAALRKLYLE